MAHSHHVHRRWGLSVLKIGGRRAWPHLLTSSCWWKEQPTFIKESKCCTQRTLRQHRLCLRVLVGWNRASWWSGLGGAGSTGGNNAVCFVALKPPLSSEWTSCDSLGWFLSSFSLLVSHLPTESGQEATLTQPPSAPCRLWSSVPSKGKRAALWGQKLHFSHDMVCSEESACLCS